MSGYTSDFPQDLTLHGSRFVPGSDRIVVLGGGVMGPGIAIVFAEHGFDVDLCDINKAAIARAQTTLRDALQLKVELGLVPAKAADATIARVRMHAGSEGVLPGARLVIEAVTENRDVKTAIYALVNRLCARDTVVWSNTSTMNVFPMAPDALRERLVVAHWFAPPHILPLVELVGDERTPASALSEAQTILRALGKAPVQLEKFVPGFIINRLLRALGREAFDMIESGVITAENLDAAVRASLAPRMVILGIMQRYDFTGLNLSLRNLADPDIVDAPINPRPASLVERVERGELGVTTGRGFYDYGGRSLAELLRERDMKLWQVVTDAGSLVSDPSPL